MSNIFQYGPEGRHISVDSAGRIIANSSSGDAPFIYAYGPEGHPMAVDASGRLLIVDVSASSGGGGSGATNLNELSDVLLTSATSGQFLQYDGVFWENIDLTLETISNVSGSAISGQFLNYNGTNWIPSDVILALDDLSNVIEGSPNETDVLVYSGTTWVPSGLTTFVSSLVPVDSVNGQTGVVVLDIDDINDVSTSGVSETDVLVYDGGTWVPSGLSSFVASSVTYETLDSNGDIGTGSGQVASGNHTHQINDLTDVTITTPASGEVLKYDGSTWINDTATGSASLSGLTDTDVSGVNTGDALIYSGTTWIPSGLNTLIDSRVTYEILDSNGDVGTGSGQVASGGHKHVEADITDLQAYLLNITGEPIGDLSDVTITSVASGEILKHNGSIWINNTLAEAGIASGSHTHVEADITDLQAYLLDITGENIGDLSNVNVAGQTETDVLALSGTTWIPSGISFPVTSVNGETGAVDLVLNDISDVITTTPASGEVLKFNGTNWVNAADASGIQTLTVSGLSDTDVSGVQDTDVLAYSGGTWIPSGITYPVTSVNGETGAVDLIVDDLSDVVIAGIASGELLKWDGSDWINNTLSEAGISAVGHTHVEADITDLQAYLLDITGENIGDLANVNVAGQAETDVLALSGTTWIPSGISFPVTSVNGETGAVDLVIDDLSDVTITSAASGEIIRYSGTTWINSTLAEAGIPEAGHTHVEADITDLQAYLLDITGEPIGDLSDVTLSSVATGEILKYNGSIWINNTLAEAGISAVGHTHVEADITDLQAYLLDITGENLEDLSNVTVTTPASGQVLTYNGSIWINQAGAAGSLSGLSDTNVVGASETDFLVYSGTTWVPSGATTLIDSRVTYEVLDANGDVGTAGTQLASGNHTHVEADITDLQAYLLDITGEPIGDLSDVTLTSVADGELLRYNGSIWINNTLAEAGVSAVGHTHVEADITDLQAYLLDITAENIEDLANVTITTPASGEVLKYNGTIWINDVDNGGTLSGLLDTNVTGATETDVLAYSGTTWVPSGISFPVTSVNGETGAVDLVAGDLSDVTITSVATGEILKYNGSIWINNTLAEAGISAVGHTHVEADITDLQAYLLDITSEPIQDLSNVTITSVADGEVLRFNGSIWINNTLAEAGISAVGHTHTESDITDLQSYLLNITGEPIGDLSDVTITSVATGEILKYNGSIWINNTLAEAGISAVGHTHTESDITDLQSYLLDITSESLGDLSDVTLTSPASGSVLKYNGSAWIDDANGPWGNKVTTISASLTGTVNTVYLAETSSGGITVTLPASHANGDRIIIKDIDGDASTNNVGIAATGPDTVDGQGTTKITSDYGAKTVISDGSDWWII